MSPSFKSVLPENLFYSILATEPHGFHAEENFDYIWPYVPKDGVIIEGGVANGRTINHIAKLAPHRRIYGFDTFEGLPEEWNMGVRVVPKGEFSQRGILPKVAPNVTLIKGLIQDTLPRWKQAHQDYVALLHVDVDLYSSSKSLLMLLNDRLKPGSIVVFDDLCPWAEVIKNGSAVAYPSWQDHEWLALHEWLSECRRKIAPISRLPNYVVTTLIIE